MGGGEWIAIAIIALVVGGAIFYIVKAKKSGRKCIGCPDGCSCKSKNGKCGGGEAEEDCCCCNKEK